MPEEKIIMVPYSTEIVNQIINEINNFESGSVTLSNRVSFSQYQTVQKIITHQNRGFLLAMKAGQKDDREFFDIITPMVETAVGNIDLDAKNLDVYTEGDKYLAHEYFARSIFKSYNRQTNQGIAINEGQYKFVDDGNIIARKVETDRTINSGEIWREVMPQNLYVLNQQAKTLEDTTVIEKMPMDQTEVRSMKSWVNKEKVIAMGNVSDFTYTPLYNIFYRYGEMSRFKLGKIKEEISGDKYEPQENDENDYVQALVVVARYKDFKLQDNNNDQNENLNGTVVFCEELKPEKVKITSRLELTFYKPYISARLGKFTGRFWGEGYREIGMPYQNKANEIGNRINKLMRQFKLVFWSKDKNIAGKNIMSAIKDGQILQADDLNLLNNVFPNLNFLASQWNQNLTDCEKALKAFEIASGESLPSSTSATAVAVQDRQVGKYYNFKRQNYGLFLSQVYKRWVLKELFSGIKADEAIELIGDATFFDEIVEAYADGWLLKNYIKGIAVKMAADLSTETPTSDKLEQIKETIKQSMLSQPKLYGTMAESFLKDVEFYVGIDFTGESYNKQAMISNAIALLQYEDDPNEIKDIVRGIKIKLGLPVKRYSKPSPVQQPGQIPARPINQPSGTPPPSPSEQVNNPTPGGMI